MKTFALILSLLFSLHSLAEENSPTENKDGKSTGSVATDISEIEGETPQEWYMWKTAMGLNVLYIEQPLTLSNFQGSFSGCNATNAYLCNPRVAEGLTKLVKFNDDVAAKGWMEVLRIDTWVLPFWNVYMMGLAGQTDVPIQLDAPLDFVQNTMQADSLGLGVGTVLGIGYLKHGWSALDLNYSWSKNAISDSLISVGNLTFRTGLTYNLVDSEATNFWVGGTYTSLGGKDDGTISMATMMDEGCQGFTGMKQKLCEDLLRTNFNYSIEKGLGDKSWDLLVGAEQTYKDWSFKAESALMINRMQFLASVSYTFTDGVKMN